MNVLKIASVLPVDNMDRAVASWSGLLGIGPTMRDGDAWAQFDVAGGRIALAGTDRVADTAGLMMKVDDIDDALASAEAAGWSRQEVSRGGHELRAVVTTEEGVTLVLYAALA